MNDNKLASRPHWYVRQVVLIGAAMAILWLCTAYVGTQTWPNWVKLVLLWIAGTLASLGSPFTYAAYQRRALDGSTPSSPPGLIPRSVPLSYDSGKSFPLQETLGGLVLWGAGFTVIYLAIRFIFF